jgi:SAM-dependent methyltransferase
MGEHPRHIRTELETRNSHGLEQFCDSLQERSGMRILDLAGASQQTISFVTGLGHRLYSDDMLEALDRIFGTQDAYTNQTDLRLADQFLENTLGLPANGFDGVLLWDVLQFLEPALLAAVMKRVHRLLRPGSLLFALFHAERAQHAGSGEARLEAVPSYSYRIADQRTILMLPNGRRSPAQLFNNRGLERLFQEFESVKFFLTRDALREVIVRR